MALALPALYFKPEGGLYSSESLAGTYRYRQINAPACKPMCLLPVQMYSPQLASEPCSFLPLSTAPAACLQGSARVVGFTVKAGGLHL